MKPQERQTGWDQHIAQFRRMAMQAGLPMPVLTLAPDAKTAEMEVNHGRWLARCPYCNGAELVRLDDPGFWCMSCQSEAVGRHILPLVVPAVNFVKQIEALLSVRKIENQNWQPKESMEDLRQENVAHLTEMET